MQPRTGSQVSTVQGLSSSQLGGVPATQLLFTQVWGAAQTSPFGQSPSLTQQPAIGAFTQPPAPPLAVGSQLSVVHTLPSSQLGGVRPPHCPAAGLQVARPLQNWLLSQTVIVWLQTFWTVSQVSVVQRSWSSQSASTLQQPATGGKLHEPVAWSHVLVVQTSLSSQTTVVPAWHIMFATSQVSTPLQAFPSSQSASEVQQPGIGAFKQAPVLLLAVASQLSAVHTMPSSQVGCVPSTHVPSAGLQVAMPLQNWLLSQVTAAGCAHAPCPSHWSAVQAFASSVQAVPAGVAHWVFSLQGPLLHSAPFTQGSPLCTHSLMFVSQDSVPLQKTPSPAQSVFVRHGVCAQAVRPLATVTATTAPTSITNDLILMPHPPKCRNRSATVARAPRTLVVLAGAGSGRLACRHP